MTILRKGELKMKRLSLTVSCIMLLSSCLDAEKFALSLDLKDKTAEVGYSNIVSSSEEEDKIKGDFEELLKTAYGSKDDQGDSPRKPISATLTEDGGKLDGVARYSFKDNSEMLKEYEIRTDEKGDYIFDLSKESNLEYAGGNGTYIEDGKKRFVRWDSTSTSLKVKLNNKAFDAKDTSLLSYWLEWKKKNPK